MMISAELRWFWREGPPAGVEHWFRNGRFPPGGGNPRDDEYLIDREQVELGVKQRGGKAGVEIKGVIETRTLMSEPFSGTVQIWSKWTSEALTIEGLPRITVHKTRWLRKYDTSRSEIRELPLDAKEQLRNSKDVLPANGCNVEFVSLSVGGKHAWWTFGFEAFGKLDTVEESLHKVAQYLSQTAPPKFGSRFELSYPQWLAMHIVA